MVRAAMEDSRRSGEGAKVRWQLLIGFWYARVRVAGLMARNRSGSSSSQDALGANKMKISIVCSVHTDFHK